MEAHLVALARLCGCAVGAQLFRSCAHNNWGWCSLLKRVVPPTYPAPPSKDMYGERHRAAISRKRPYWQPDAQTLDFAGTSTRLRSLKRPASPHFFLASSRSLSAQAPARQKARAAGTLNICTASIALPSASELLWAPPCCSASETTPTKRGPRPPAIPIATWGWGGAQGCAIVSAHLRSSAHRIQVK